MLKNIEVILSMIAPALTLLCTTLVFLKGKIKNKRMKNILENASKITSQIIPLIEQAEEFVNYSGEEKKEYVLTKLERYAINNKLKFDKEEISNKIEELITMSKQVNSKSKTVNKEALNCNNYNDIEEKLKQIVGGVK